MTQGKEDDPVEAMRVLWRLINLNAEGDDPVRAVETLRTDPEEQAWFFELSCPRAPRGHAQESLRYDEDDEDEDWLFT